MSGVIPSAAQPDIASDERVLSDAAIRAASELGLTQTTLAEIIGRSRSRLRDGIAPQSKSGELALLFIRVYRGLYALLGGDQDAMRRWMMATNRGTGGIPAEQVSTVDGLVRVLGYIDGMRGKV